MTDGQEWITTSRAAQMLGVRSINTVKRLIRDGRLRAIQPGSHYRVAAEDVRRIVTNAPRASTPPDPAVVARGGWLARWANQHRVARVALFGSAARGELRPDSDVDVVIEFRDDATAGLFEMVQMRAELAERFERSVDLGTLKSMKPAIRQHAEHDMVSLYEA